ncbi:MAG: U32 family peptidase [Clostridia bacterium]|nr:U32 family peptidase [Clostridia bacterium]
MSMELLAPAGNFEKLKYAVWYGADAVYCAFRSFSLRAAGGNFDEQQLQEAVDFCHQAGKKIYVAVNIYPTEEDLKALPAFLEFLESLRPDGMIIADLGILRLAKRYAPSIPIHISTQANVTNYEAAMAYHELGACRLVLAREATLEQIRSIGSKIPSSLELECFVHGAMCISYSGRCLLSAAMTDRSANRGACSHPCRWNYALMEEQRPGEYFPIQEDERGTYLLNSKDLCLMPYLKELEEAGVKSLKIEGRMKSFYYAACTARAYRKALDDLKAGKPFDERLLEELKAVSHRDYTTGFFFGTPDADAQNPADSGYRRTTDVVAVADEQEGWLIQKNKFSVGEPLWILSPDQEPQKIVISAMEDESGAPIESAPHAQMRVRVPFSLPAHSILRREHREK